MVSSYSQAGPSHRYRFVSNTNRPISSIPLNSATSPISSRSRSSDNVRRHATEEYEDEPLTEEEMVEITKIAEDDVTSSLEEENGCELLQALLATVNA
jgi:hypothetical protein